MHRGDAHAPAQPAMPAPPLLAAVAVAAVRVLLLLLSGGDQRLLHLLRLCFQHMLLLPLASLVLPLPLLSLLND